MIRDASANPLEAASLLVRRALELDKRAREFEAMGKLHFALAANAKARRLLDQAEKLQAAVARRA